MGAIATAGVYNVSKQPIQGSFKISSSINVAVTDVNSNTGVLGTDLVMISSADYYRMEANAPATIASPLFPPGITPFVIRETDDLNFIRLGSTNFELSVIRPG